MTSEIVRLGEHTFGLLEVPASPHAEPLCMVLLNAGFIDRRGPFRLHVRLARALALAGIHTFRHDAQGIGDSLPRSDAPLLQSSLAALDVVAARTGCKRFIVGGICSAADLGWQLALADPRVVGVLLIDGVLRKGVWYTVGRLARALRKSPRSWMASIALRRRGAAAAAPTISDDDLRDWPTPGAEREQLATLVARQVELLFVFTGGASYALHPRQFGDTYGAAARAPNVRSLYWPHCDHTFFAESHRRELIEAVGAWASTRFG